MPVPWVDPTNPGREPTDKEPEALTQSVCDKAVERNRQARERFMAKLRDSIARAARGETGPGPSGGRPEEETAQTPPRRCD